MTNNLHTPPASAPDTPPNANASGGVQRIIAVAKKIWRRIENIVFSFVVLLIALYFLLQLPAVQNWLVQKVATHLSEALNTTVQVGHVDLVFFDNLSLERVYIADQHGDTLIYAGSIVAGLNANLFTIFDNNLSFNELSLKDTKFHLTRLEGERNNSLKFLIDYFGGNKPKTPGKPKTPFPIRVQRLALERVEFIQQDIVRGEYYRLVVPDGLLRIKNADIPSKIVDIESVVLKDVFFDYEEHERKPLPPLDTPTAVPDTAAKAPPRPFEFLIGKLSLENCRFDMDRFRASPARETLPNVMDYNHLQINGIHLLADSVAFNSDYLAHGRILQFGATEQSGFQVKQGASKWITACDTAVTLTGMELQLAESRLLADTFRFDHNTYRDFRKFNNNVVMTVVATEGSHIRLGDLRFFRDALAKNSFFNKNEALDIKLSGRISGKVNDLKGRNLNLKIGDQTTMRGGFDGEDMGRSPDIMRLMFKFDRLETTIPALKTIVPGFKPTATVERLGRVSFTGNYQFLFGRNHILDGQMYTDVGNGDVDMQLDMTDGREKARYSGEMIMSKLNLGALTGSKDLGTTSFHLTIAKGSRGLTLHSMRATVEGVIDTFTYRGYQYRNIKTDGTFSENLFDGKLGVTDPNIDFLFDGTVNFKDSIPVYNFKADIKRLNLGKLNLVDDDLVATATIPQVRLTGRSLNDLNGSAVVKNIRITQSLETEDIVHRIDSIRFESASSMAGSRRFNLRSDVLIVNADGVFNLNNIPRNLTRMLSQYFPEYAAQLQLPAYDSVQVSDRYRFGLYISDTRQLTKLFDTALDTLRNISIGGQVDGSQGITDMYANIPHFKYGGFVANNLKFSWRTVKNQLRSGLELPDLSVSGNKIPPVIFSMFTRNEELQFSLQQKGRDTTNIVKSIDLNGNLAVVDSAWQVRFNNSNLDLFNQNWYISENNRVTFGRGYVITHDFDLMNDVDHNRRILLDSLNGGRGLKLTLSNFDLNFLNEILPRRGLIYRGRLQDFDISVGDIFKMKNITLNVATDTVFLNNTPYGRIDGYADLPSMSEPFVWRLSSIDRNFSLITRGGWLLKGDQPKEAIEVGLLQPGEMQMNAVANNFPMSVLQQFIPGISGTKGQFDLNVKIGGKMGKKANIGMDGKAMIKTGEFQIDYLRSTYHVRNQPILLTNYLIWAGHPKGDTVYDHQARRRAALVTGGLRHNHFRDWRIDCTVASMPGEDFLVMNTTKKDNPLYYGTAFGAFTAKFSGTFSRTDIKVNATTGNNTRLFIPLTDPAEVKENRFIKFKPKPGAVVTPTPGKKTDKQFQQGDLKGLSFEMNLSMTDNAEVQMIFDEQAGDIIKGRGVGDISLIINREGEFKMYGNYIVKRGEYLFTLLNIVNKPFSVKEGGTIIWYGDPYQAQIDINATYEENTALTNLLRDVLEIANPDLVPEAANSTRAVVTMHLTGDLFKPTIDFDLEFPNVSSQMRTYTENKLRSLRQDPNEMNRQVFGLVVLGSFLLPDTYSANYGQEVVNTLTQMITSQLSGYLSELASEWFGNKVSSIDFDIAYNDYTQATNPLNPSQSSGRDFQFRLRSGFNNDRITFQLGSQFGTSAALSNDAGFLGQDVVVEIQPTANRQWKVRIYERTEPDPTFSGNLRTRLGAGISFRKEFNNFEEMTSGIRSAFRRHNRSSLLIR